VNDHRFDQLLAGRQHDPLEILGVHRTERGWVVRHTDPHAAGVALRDGDQSVPLIAVAPGLWEVTVPREPPKPLRLVVDHGDSEAEIISPWVFPPSICDDDLYLFNAGRLTRGWKVLGAIVIHRGSTAGVRFACWAPNAERVSVVGDFNQWDGRVHPMISRGASGVW